MAKLIIQPKQVKYIVTHPVTDEKYFENADGKKIQGVFHLVGTSSIEFYNYINDISSNDVLGDEDSTEAEHKRVDSMVASLIVGWDDNGFVDVPYSKKECKNLLNDPQNRWLKQQLQIFITEQSNFFTTAAKS